MSVFGKRKKGECIHIEVFYENNIGKCSKGLEKTENTVKTE